MSQQGIPTQPGFEGSVAAAFPVAILESVRSHDRPGEVLEDEDLTISLPRRFGLTGVVDTQSRRYEAAQREGRTVRLEEVMGLVRLVLRRPDADPILRETGERLARWHFRRTPGLWQRVLQRGPTRLALRSARRAAVRALRDLQAGSRVEGTRPFTLRVDDPVTTRLQEGIACTLFTGLLEEQVRLYTGTSHAVSHRLCAAHGYDVCEWGINEDA
jgi:hypothetical protein